MTLPGEPEGGRDRDHYARLVARWSHFGPPLRPSPDDTAVVQRAIRGLGPRARALVLGLTPESLGCQWPKDIHLTAVDHSPQMIRTLWPPEGGPANARVILADWSTLPVVSDSLDLVAGDGCFNLGEFPEGFERLAREIGRVLRPSGRLVMRVYLRPDPPESVQDIARAIRLGRVGSVHALKMRLWAALDGASGPGTRLDDVWRAWTSLPRPADLGKVSGWTDDEMDGLESYRGLTTRYFLPALDAFRQALKPWLKEVECAWGSYELAERCPTFVFTPPGSAWS